MNRLLLHNARLRSFHDGFKNEAADAILISGSLIAAIGRTEDLEPLTGPDCMRIDVKGRTLMPGFHDSHIHLWKIGNLMTYMLDVRRTADLEDMLGMLRQYHDKYPDAPWITARGFNEAGWKEGRMPTRQDLDKIIPGKPVYLIRTCAHIAVCNSRALEICHITKTTKAPPGGRIHTDEWGEPNGIFSETALGLITAHIPPYTKSQLKTMIRAARGELYRHGITAATDPAVDPLLLEAYRELDDEGDLGLRLQAIPILLPDGGDRPFPLPLPFSTRTLSVNTVKFFSDGGLSGATAALKRPYKDSQAKGILRLDKDQFLTLARVAHEKGLGIATHAIGDAAIGFVIDIYRQLHGSFPDALRRIEHLGLPEPGHLLDMAALDIAASMQTIFIRELGKNFIRHLDQEYLDRCYPVRSAMQQGVLVALSSDAPVVKDFNPFAGIQTAITRRDGEGSPIAPEETIGITDALKAYTVNAARISRTSCWGSLGIGKNADLIILDKDPLITPTKDLDTIRVEATYVDGTPVWTR